MSSTTGSQLNNRKPFKLLAQFDQLELDAVHSDLKHMVATSSGKRNLKLLTYFEQWCLLDTAKKPVTREEFTEGTKLPASANAFDKLTSLFYNYLQEFLARQELLRDPIAIQQLAFRAYRKRPFDWKEIQRRHGEAHRELDKLPQSSRLSHERLILDLDLATQASDRTIPSNERGYTDLLAALEADYVTQRLRLLCAIANDKRIFAAPAPELAIAETIPPYRESWPALAKMYYRVYQLLTGEENSTSMARLRGLLDNQAVGSPGYPRADMLDLYGYLLNALARKVNLGHQEAVKELNLLYDHLIEKEILLEEGRIAAGHFKNIISLKIKAGEITSARKLYDQLSGKVANDPDQNAVRYNHTLILYAEEQLEEAALELETLCAQTQNLKLDLFYGLDMRANLLKIYYDLLEKTEANPLLWDETDEKMKRLLESLKGYIERKKIPNHRQQSYETFRKLIQSLYIAAFGNDIHSRDGELKALENEIKTSPDRVDVWFRKRLEWIAANR